jgi:hypothetical protein
VAAGGTGAIPVYSTLALAPIQTLAGSEKLAEGIAFTFTRFVKVEEQPLEVTVKEMVFEPATDQFTE